jgi:hypothetical protein
VLRPAITGLAAGSATAAVIVAFRLLSGPAASISEQGIRFFGYVWLAAGAGASATLILAVVLPRRGLGTGAFAGPAASLTAVAGFLALNTALGAPLTSPMVSEIARPSLALGLLLAVLAAPAGLVSWRSGWEPARSWVLWPAVVALGLAVAVALLTARGQLVLTLPGPAPTAGGASEVSDYVTVIAPQIQQRFSAIGQVMREIDADPELTAAERAARTRAEAIPPLQSLLADARAHQPVDQQVDSVHQFGVAALQSSLDALTALADAWEEDLVEPQRFQIEQQEALEAWQAWEAGLAELSESVE